MSHSVATHPPEDVPPEVQPEKRASGAEIAPLVEDLACPVSFIYGEHDWMQPASGANVARRRLAAGKGASCVVVPGSAGHYVFLEDPAAFLDALLRRVGR